MKHLIFVFLILGLYGCGSQQYVEGESSAKNEPNGVVTGSSKYSEKVRHIILFPVTYSDEAYEARVTGSVAAKFQINEKGRAVNIEILNSDNELIIPSVKKCLDRNLFVLAKTEEARAEVHEVTYTFTEQHLKQTPALLEVRVQ